MPSITTAVKRLLRLTSRHLGGEGTGRPFPLSPRVTGNGIQAASRSPPPPGRSRGLLPPPSRGRAVHGDSPDTVHGKETGFHGVFGETDKSLPPTGHRIFGGCQVRPRSSGLLPWHCVYGRIAPVGEAARRGGGWNSLPPLSPVSHRRRLSMRAVDQPPPPSPTSPQCRLAKNRTIPL